MEKISLSSFKAFAGNVDIDIPDKKNLLVYGENGAGKSSLYEAIRLFFYEDRLVSRVIPEGAAEEVAEAEKKSYLRTYNNKSIGHDYELKINDMEHDVFPINDYACYMLSYQDVQDVDELRVDYILNDVFMPEINVGDFLNDNKNNLLLNVNNAIRQDFMEQMTLSYADIYTTIKITDPLRNLSPEKNYRQFINEAKLHLIKLLLVFETIKLLKPTLAYGKHKLLVLDDIVTSLDATNRIFLVNYLFGNFKDYQIVLLTHNVSFFNLIHFKVGEGIDGTADLWYEYNIYESGNDSKVYRYLNTKDASSILSEYDQDSDRTQAGNKIRQRFEAVMYEYAKLIHEGQFEESGLLLIRLLNEGKPLYVKCSGKKVQKSSQLVDEIIASIREPLPAHEKLAKVINHIQAYHKDEDVAKVAELLRGLKMFQKVVMHQLSHNTGAMATFTDKEIRSSIELLKEFERIVSKFRNKNPYGM